MTIRCFYLREELAPLRPVELPALEDLLEEALEAELREGLELRVAVLGLVLRLPEALVLLLLEAPLILVLDEPELFTLLFTVVLAVLLEAEGTVALGVPLTVAPLVVVPVLRLPVVVVLREEDALVLLCPEAVLLLEVELCTVPPWVAARTDLAAELVLVAVVLVTASASRFSLRSLALIALVDSTPSVDLLFAMMSALRSVKECSGWSLP